MRNSNLFVAFAAICVVLGTAGMVNAHQTWMEIDAMCIDLGDTVDVRLTEGHNFIPARVRHPSTYQQNW